MALFDDLPGCLGQMHQNPFTKFSRTCDLVEIPPDATQQQHPNLGWVVLVATLLNFGFALNSPTKTILWPICSLGSFR